MANHHDDHNGAERDQNVFPRARSNASPCVKIVLDVELRRGQPPGKSLRLALLSDMLIMM